MHQNTYKRELRQETNNNKKPFMHIFYDLYMYPKRRLSDQLNDSNLHYAKSSNVVVASTASCEGD